MQEILDQIQDQLRGAWRFRWTALFVALGVCFAGWAVIFLLPDRYRASAKVYVDTHSTISQVTSGISLESNVETQIDRVRQQMLGAPALQKVGDETDLFRGGVTLNERQKRIEKLRKEIAIKGTGGTGVYSIEYENPDRDMSVRVVDKLLNTFVEGTMGGKLTGTQKAQKFLTEQIDEYGKRLSEAETNVAEFKKRNFGVMPGEGSGYYSNLQSQTATAQKLDGELQSALQERAALKAQLSGQQPWVSQEAGGAAAGSSPNSPTSQRIREAETRLDGLLERYTDKHPEVIGLRETIADLKKRQATELAAARNGDAAAAASAGLVSNPVYQQIQLDFNKNEVRIAKLQADLAVTRKEVDRLRSALNMTANVEAQFTQLNRDYDTTKAQYLALLQRKEQTRLGVDAQETGTVAFEIVDPPSAAFEPVAPVRALLIPAVLVIALGLGGGVAYLLHLLHPVFYTSRALEAATGLRVIGVVPLTWLDRYRTQFRREVLRYSSIVAGLVLFAILVIWQQARLTELTAGFRL